jgi:hypothetical protein
MARRGRPPKAPRQIDLDRVKALASDMQTVVYGDEGEDINGHRIAVKFGYLTRLVDELVQEVID